MCGCVCMCVLVCYACVMCVWVCVSMGVCVCVLCVCTTGGILPVLAKWWVPEVWRVHSSTAGTGGPDWLRPP